MAARKGNTSRAPRVSTRATSAAMLGPGEPDAISRAPAKIASDASVIVVLQRPRGGDLPPPRPAPLSIGYVSLPRRAGWASERELHARRQWQAGGDGGHLG